MLIHETAIDYEYTLIAINGLAELPALDNDLKQEMLIEKEYIFLFKYILLVRKMLFPSTKSFFVHSIA